jgi:hypothetical protein
MQYKKPLSLSKPLRQRDDKRLESSLAVADRQQLHLAVQRRLHAFPAPMELKN